MTNRNRSANRTQQLKNRIALLLLALQLIAALLLPARNLQAAGAGTMSGAQRAAAADKGSQPAGEPAALQRGVQRYLDSSFQIEELGEAGNWQNWIITDDGSDWSISQLRMVRAAIQNTVAALESTGQDGYELLAGYRFNRFSGQYLPDGSRRQAEVNHEMQLITLADQAFLNHRGFVIYHELGHVADRQLGRRLTSLFQDQTLRAGANGDSQLVDGYWLREQAHTSPSEAAADALAIWVLVDFAGYDMPEFPSMPEMVDAPVLFELVERGLR
jgi:hypothetical protein